MQTIKTKTNGSANTTAGAKSTCAGAVKTEKEAELRKKEFSSIGGSGGADFPHGLGDQVVNQPDGQAPNNQTEVGGGLARNVSPLTDEERKELSACNKGIRRGLRACLRDYIEVGRLLHSVRNKRLYREEFDSFAGYCRSQLEIAGSTGHHYITCFEVMTALSAIADTASLAKEIHIRPLIRLQSTERDEVIDLLKTKAASEPLTPKLINRVAAEVRAQRPRLTTTTNGAMDGSGATKQITSSSARSKSIVVLWDSSESKASRAPEKSYSSKVYPNLVFFNFHQPGDFDFSACSKHGLTHLATFAVPVEPTTTIMDGAGSAYCKANCRFLTLSVRGGVPTPASVPGLVVDGDYLGVVEMITSMFPDAFKVVSTTRPEAPNGWEHVPRESSFDTSSASSEIVVPELASRIEKSEAA